MRRDEDARPGAERVLNAVRDAPQGVAAGEIAERLGLHVTTVRFHLERLASRGRIVGATVHTGGRGRPHVIYQAVRTPDARAGMLAALADAAAGSGSVATRAQRAGEEWARSWSADGRPTQDVILEVFGQLGFAPQEKPDGVLLRACPFLDDARRHPDVVCGVHRGLAIGLARRAGGSVTLVPFAPGGCVLTLE